VAVRAIDVGQVSLHFSLQISTSVPAAAEAASSSSGSSVEPCEPGAPTRP